jgi:N-acetyl-1-D-myo-inositol-2-amino-2-deoxy-alpha-D-glucopyranoside deacetylase
VFGAIGTVAHQGTSSLGGAVLPTGLVVSMVMATALLVGFRQVFRSRTVVAAVAVGLLGVTALLSQPGAGGSALVPANLAGYLWTFGPVLVAMVVLAWPFLDRGADVQRGRDKMDALPDAKGTPQT